MKVRIWLVFGLIAIFATESTSYQCSRIPQKVTKPQNRLDIDRFIIEISGNPKEYIPGESYHVRLKANIFSPSSPPRKYFTEFNLVAESTPSSSPQPESSGSFHLVNHMTRFHLNCRNTVIQTNNLPKTQIDVMWIAPPANSGCVELKAMVYETSDNWFIDSGQLKKTLCEASENPDVQPPILESCCSCDEAKYEIAFQGLWSRNTHPRDFPENAWMVKFSDIVGASHKPFKSFWNYNEMASPGLKSLAEEGDTKLLETELKEMVKSDDIRTIVKARELAYPNNTGTSYTVFRVDSDNHVISLVSKITPSPDWIVGVAELELCLENCSWVESRIFNLYPYDVGTDDGPSYISADEPTEPQDVIRKIEINNLTESSFYSPDGEPMKPFATIHLTRQKVYQKTCTRSEENEDCATTEWSEWSSCSEDCTRTRERSYNNPAVAKDCQETLEETAPCTESKHCRNQIDENDEKCQVTPWSEWSECSVTCGKGVQMRERQFVQSAYQNLCPKSIELQETTECEAEQECEISPLQEEEEECEDTVWTEWSPCSVSCGDGVKVRYRVPDESDKIDEDKSCNSNKETVPCQGPSCEDFNSLEVGNSVREEESDDTVTDCQISEWSVWGPCDGQPCKKGYQTKHRFIKIYNKNGGRACPKKLQKKKKCKVPCSDDKEPSIQVEDVRDSRETLPTWGPGQPNEDIKVDCVMGKWSQWSPCNHSCGSSTVQQRTRSILVHPRNGGKPCGSRIQTKRCRLPIACLDDISQ